jgi:DNA (cytosine-5)-methyltransferase 1
VGKGDGGAVKQWRALDLFCGAGGATKGLQKAGFHVTGVDIKRQPRYCGDQFVQANVQLLPLNLATFDFIWSSPPCQRYSYALNCIPGRRNAHPDLIASTRALVEASCLPFVIENVPGAPLLAPITLCGLVFPELNVKRHRLFESNLILESKGCGDHTRDYYVIFGRECRNRRHGSSAGRKNKLDVGKQAMGIDWMTRGELSESIPPAYSEFLGKQVIAYLETTK